MNRPTTLQRAGLGCVVLFVAFSTAQAQTVLIASQDFNDLDASGTFTSDSLPSGSQLTNAGSNNTGGPGLDFASFWTDTRGVTSGPVTPTSDSSDFIGVNSFAGSNSPDVAADGTAVADGVEHNYEFNDTDGQLDLVLEAVDLSGVASPTVSFDYWINSTGFEADDVFAVTVDDGVNPPQTLLSFGETELEANTSADDGTTNWNSATLSLVGLDPAQVVITISVDTNSGTENIFIDNVIVEGLAAPQSLAQGFNDLSTGTFTTDSVPSGSSLTNSGSFNAGGPDLDFQTFWIDTRGVGSGPVTPTNDSSDFIGVNSFTGSNSPDVAADGTPVMDGAEHNFEFNDGDGRLDLVFEAVDVSQFTNPAVSFDYWIAATGYESDDAFFVTVDDGSTQQTFLNFSEPELEANASPDDGTANWNSAAINLSGFDPTQIVVTVSVDTNSGSENIFVDNVLFAEDTRPPGPQEVAIHEVQGNGAASPLEGVSVIVEGVVVGDFQENNELNGLFIQEEDADVDADPATSEGVFVFCGGGCPDVGIGNIVRVTGTVDEAFGQTQIDNDNGDLDVVVITAGNNLGLITPAQVTFPVANGEDLEAFEGMSAQVVTSMRAVEFFNFDRFSEIRVWNDNGIGADRPFQYTQLNLPDVDGVEAAEELFRRSSILLDDGSTSQSIGKVFPQSAGVPIFGDASFNPGDPAAGFRGGDVFENIEGVLAFGFGEYRIHISDLSAGTATDGDDFDITIDNTNPRDQFPNSVGGNLSVASFNVLNYFLTIDAGPGICGPTQDEGCRGADSTNELDRQRDKILDALARMDADVIGLIELENTPGVEPEADLVAGLNALLGVGTYAVVDAADGGVVGPDVIRVGLIYRPWAVTPVGDPALLTFSLDSLGEDRSRTAVAQSFFENSSGAIFTVVVNHFKSKSGSEIDDNGGICSTDPAYPDCDQRDGQGFFSATRAAHAQELLDWLATDPTSGGDPDFLILGDLNAYAMEDAIGVLTDPGAGYTDLVQQFEGASAYSFGFDGRWGTLDYAFANAPLLAQVSGATEWHANADEPDALSFDESFSPSAWFEPNAFRASDHDPIIVGLSLEAPDADGDGVNDPFDLCPDTPAGEPVDAFGCAESQKDDDHDGVNNDNDLCPNTMIPESAPTSNRGLGMNRWALRNADGQFIQGPPQSGRVFSFTTTETRGCSCEQIVEVAGLGQGHLKFGCSTGVMLSWINSQ